MLWKVLSSCSGGLRPLVELLVEPEGLCGRCTGVSVPLRRSWMGKSPGEKQKVQSATQEPGISVINKSQIGLLHPPRHPPPLSRPQTLPRLSLASLLPWVMFPLKPSSIPPPALHLRVCRGMKCPANISVFTLKYKDNYTSRSNSRLCICYQVLRALFWKAIMPM